ncbi:MAG: glucose-1-phosphate adenylyltransferase [Candidatus Omnitrophica bacterium]|nr:glucose-1-phosphate adenylyltransferase [Candidatus Omnitrophota bacterium]
MRKTLTFILAGGRGERLDPLTRDRAKPAVPFAGIYRIIDYTLSNCVNSGLRRIYVLTQYKSFSLQKHLLAGWDVFSSQLGEFIDVIPAQQRISSDWYKGTADAIYQNIYAINDCEPDRVLILAGDHIYKMNYRDMVKFHEEKNADVTVACVNMPKEMSKDFGVVEVNADNLVLGFQEKPVNPKVIPSKKSEIFASMGIYLFKTDALLTELEIDSKNVTSNHDFGKNIIPQMLKRKKMVYVYDFAKSAGGKPVYWRDIGTRDAYYQANMDLLKEHSDFDLYDKDWRVRTYHEQYPPIRMITTSSGSGAIYNSMISGGCIIEGGEVDNSILSPNVTIKEGALVENSIIMEGVEIGKNAKVRNAIIDKEVIIPAGAKIGYDLELDKKRFVLTTSGIVIVPKKTDVSKK